MASSKDKTQPARSTRLTEAVRLVRASGSGRFSTTASRAGTVVESEPARQAAVKYPKSSSALRQHVTEVQETAKTAPAVRLRLRPPPTHYGGGEPQPIRREAPASRAVETRPAVAAGPVHLSGAVATPSDLAQLVRQARKRQGLTQDQLAKRAGTGRRFILELEAGKPTLEFGRALKVCAALGVQLFAIVSIDER